MTSRKGVVILLVVACVVLFVMPLVAQEKGKETYKIGAIVAVTGKASWLGAPERNTLRMLTEKLNKAGGINDHPIEMIIEDTESDETKTVNAIKKLISKDNVLAVIGPSQTGETMAVIPIVEEAEVPLISCAAGETIILPVKKWVFKTPQSDAQVAEKMFVHMKAHKISKIAIISVTTGFGDQGRKQLKALAPKMGIEIVADETYGPSDTDMTAQLTKIKAAAPQAVVNWSIGPVQSIVPKNLRQLGMTMPFYQSHGFGSIKYVKAAGEAAEGTRFPAGRLLVADVLPDTHPQKQVLASYKKEYLELFPKEEEVSTFGGHAYDAFCILVEALKRAGPNVSADKAGRAKLRDEIEKTKGFVGTAGIFNMTPQDHMGLTTDALEMLTVKDGKFAVLKD
jgi:branched-chain amino acid transport system substrate-binding protein